MNNKHSKSFAQDGIPAGVFFCPYVNGFVNLEIFMVRTTILAEIKERTNLRNMSSLISSKHPLLFIKQISNILRKFFFKILIKAFILLFLTNQGKGENVIKNVISSVSSVCFEFCT
jgi:hypothetical protein